MKSIKFIIFISVLFVILCTAAFPCMASMKDGEQSIAVIPILPANQKAGVTGYFNLLVNPDEKQTVYVQIKNNKNENIVVNLEPANAYTRPEGGIFYEADLVSPETILTDKSFALSNYLSTDKSIALNPNETVKIPVHITVPNIRIGSILGGILISEQAPAIENRKDTEKKNEAKFKVITKTTFAVAIQLDLPKMPAPAFSFEKASFNSNGAKVLIEMRNDAPVIQREISGVYKVAGKGGKLLFEGKIAPMIMAPKTQMRYPFPWNYPTLESGTYTLSITATVAGEKITVDKTFIIDDKAVEEYSEQTNQPIAKMQIGKLYLIIIPVVIVTGSFIFYLVRRKRFKNASKITGNQLRKNKPKHFFK